MNKAKSAAVGLLISALIFVFSLGIFYYLVLDNFIIVAKAWGHDLSNVRDNLFFLMIGLSLLSSISASIKIYEYSRRGKSIKE